MHDVHLRGEARRLAAQGMSSCRVARELALPQTTIHRWITRRTPTDDLPPHTCFRCNEIDPAPELAAAILTVRGKPPADRHLASTERARKIESRRKHWPCLLPQHGPGRKHERPIVLADWQERLVADHPWPLIRGLIHSDGCRAINRVVVRGKAYEYPRYFFSNRSRDILGILGEALDRVGVAWRYNLPISISIAKRAAVALMDEHVGPKS